MFSWTSQHGAEAQELPLLQSEMARRILSLPDLTLSPFAKTYSSVPLKSWTPKRLMLPCVQSVYGDRVTAHFELCLAAGQTAAAAGRYARAGRAR